MEEYEDQVLLEEARHRQGQQEGARADAVQYDGRLVLDFARSFAIALGLAAAGCGSSEAIPSVPDVLRVSAGGGLSEFAPDVQGTITVSAIELVFVQASRHLTLLTSNLHDLRFARRPEATFELGTLARALRAPGLIGVRVEGEVIVAMFAPDQQTPALPFIGLDLGPFVQASFSPAKLVLRRRSGVGVGTIEFIGVGSEDEEWRRFLAREVDVVPQVRPSFRPYLAEVPSVAVAAYATSPSLGLVFQVAHSRFADLRLRRAVSLGIRRAAILRSVLGSDGQTIAMRENVDEARAALNSVRKDSGPIVPLRLRYATSYTEDQRTALILEQQLDELGFQVTIEPFADESADEVFRKGQFDVLLFYAGTTPMYYRRAQTANPGNITGYSNSEFDRAVAEKNDALATGILERDLPMTPLFTVPDAIAINRNFCGAKPIVATDLSWLADVHACAPGENP